MSVVRMRSPDALANLVSDNQVSGILAERQRGHSAWPSPALARYGLAVE